jgi:hypothetical protein
VSTHTFAIGDTVEVGPAYRIGGTLRPDEFTGRRGIVSQVSTDGDVEIDYGRTLWVFHQRLRPVDRGGIAGVSHNDRTFGI